MRKYKKTAYIFLVLFLLGISAEVFLRFYYGFCDTVLMEANPYYEYIARPNQDRFRFRRHIRYNSYSMRSPEPDTIQTVILGFGDSVLNGGVLTDQDSLATSLLSEELTEVEGKPVQFLNISAGSWGPDNCLAYLRQNGDFGANKIYLFVSSHDAYDTMEFDPVVGVDKSYPDRQYSLALWELADRYLLPRILPGNNDPDELEINKKGSHSRFNPGFAGFLNYCSRRQDTLVIYLHAERAELEKGVYNEQGRQIIQFAKAHNIPLVQDLNNGLKPSYFRDQIHLNDSGQKFMAKLILLNERT